MPILLLTFNQTRAQLTTQLTQSKKEKVKSVNQKSKSVTLIPKQNKIHLLHILLSVAALSAAKSGSQKYFIFITIAGSATVSQ